MALIKQMALYKFLGLPVIAFGGMFTFLLLLAAATIGMMIMKGNTKFSMAWHINLARAALVFGFVHGIFAMALFL